RALELRPGYATAHHWYGLLYLAAMGRLDEAISELQQALELDSLSLPIGSNIGLLLYLARRYEEALDHFRSHLEMDRNFVYTHWEMALAYEQCGRYDEAIAAFQRAIALSGTSVLPRTLLARTYALSGRKSEASALLNELTELSTQTYVSPYRIAAVYSALRDKDSAFKWLGYAYEGRDGWLIWLAVDPVFDSLRSDKRFTDLLNRIGLSESNGRHLGVRRLDAALAVDQAPTIPKRRQAAALHGGALIVGALLLLAAGYFLLKSLIAPKSTSPSVS